MLFRPNPTVTYKQRDRDRATEYRKEYLLLAIERDKDIVGQRKGH